MPKRQRESPGAEGEVSHQPKRGKFEKRSVSFGDVSVFYFDRVQGFSCVPTRGGITLGMADAHSELRRLSLEEHAAESEERRARALMAYNDVNTVDCGKGEPTAEPAPERSNAVENAGPSEGSSDSPVARKEDGGCVENGSGSDGDRGVNFELAEPVLEGDMRSRGVEGLPGPSEESDDEGEEGEEDSEAEEYVLQWASNRLLVQPEVPPMTVRQRKHLLRESGVQRFVRREAFVCHEIRQSREACGCDCPGGRCVPATCLCAKGGIKCQVDRFSFPCPCTRELCGNPSGRVEFDAVRVRMHYIHTMTRLRLCAAEESDAPRRRSFLGHMRFVQEENSYCDEDFVESPLRGTSATVSNCESGREIVSNNSTEVSNTVSTPHDRVEGVHTNGEIPHFSELFTPASMSTPGEFPHVGFPQTNQRCGDTGGGYQEFLRSIYEPHHELSAPVPVNASSVQPEHHFTNGYGNPAETGELGQQPTYSLSSLYPHVRPSRHPVPGTPTDNASHGTYPAENGNTNGLNGLVTTNWPQPASELDQGHRANGDEEVQDTQQNGVATFDPVIEYTNGTDVAANGFERRSKSGNAPWLPSSAGLTSPRYSSYVNGFGGEKSADSDESVRFVQSSLLGNEQGGDAVERGEMKSGEQRATQNGEAGQQNGGETSELGAVLKNSICEATVLA